MISNINTLILANLLITSWSAFAAAADYTLIKASGINACLTAGKEGELIERKPCNEDDDRQLWTAYNRDPFTAQRYTAKTTPDLCLGLGLKMKACKPKGDDNYGKQLWFLEPRKNYSLGKMKNFHSNKCLDDDIVMKDCTEANRWDIVEIDDGDDDGAICSTNGEKAEKCGAKAKAGRGEKCCAGLKCGGEKGRYCVKDTGDGDGNDVGDDGDDDGAICSPNGEKAEKCGAKAKAGRGENCCAGLKCGGEKGRYCVKDNIGNGDGDDGGDGGDDDGAICSPNGEKAEKCGAKAKAGRGEKCCAGLKCGGEKNRYCVKDTDDSGDNGDGDDGNSVKDWQQIKAPDAGKGKKFGMHAVIDEDTMVTVDFDHPMEDVFVYKRNTNGKWTFQTKIDSDDREAGDNFQYVDISGRYVAVGAKNADSNGKKDAGAAFIFKEKNGKYKQVARLAPSDLKAGDIFGNNLAIDGKLLLVGARFQNSERGAVYAYRNFDGKWKEYDKFIPSDVSKGDQFGRRINLSGETAVIAALNADDFGTDSGVAYVYQDDGNGFKEVQKLIPTDKTKFDKFGFKVDIDRDTIVVGAQNTNGKGSVYVFTRGNNDKWSQASILEPKEEEDDYVFGADVAIEGNTILVNALSEGGSGLVYVFTGSGSNWKQELKLSAENSKPSKADGFGDSLAIQKGTAVLGAPADNDETGSVYMVEL